MTDTWNWLAGTYWYVPSSNLAAPMFSSDGGAPTWMSDQTVWQITGYENGYFWGNTAAGLHAGKSDSSRRAPSPQILAGSVTPEGSLHITFTPLGSSDASKNTVGLGTMRQRDGQWAAEMQMSASASRGSTLLHWAYMLQCRPGDAAWEQLPGTDQSVPEFLKAAGFPSWA